MKFLKQGFGKILYNLGRGIESVLGFIIDGISWILNLMKAIRQGLIAIFGGLFMILALFFFGGFIGILLLPVLLNLFVIFGLLPFGLSLLNKGLKLLKYGLTEYLYDKSNQLIDDGNMRFSNIFDYFGEYIRLENEAKFREQERKRRVYEEDQRRQREAFEEFFRQSTNFGGGYYNQNTGGYNSFSGISDVGFKEKYEQACDVLNVGYTANKDEIRVAYRKKAKEYHPDLNKAENATEMFQKVNDAHEFLTDENIIKYGKAS